MTHSWSAIVPAGQRPGGDAFAEAHGVRYKGQIEIAGRPMLTRVIETLLAVPEIGRIVVLAQEPEALRALLDPRVTLIASGAGISASIAAVAGSEAAPWPVLVTTADHPLLAPHTVRDLLRRADGADVAIGMVERAVLAARYPESKRTWLKLADGWWTGANLFVLGGPAVRPALDLWASVEEDRKRTLRLFRRFGPILFLRAATRTIGLHAAVATAGRRLGIKARLIALDDPHAAIDVDKSEDLALARRIVGARG